jgi:predicted MFS family arabinose efflux permease
MNSMTSSLVRNESRAATLLTMTAICWGQCSTALVYDAFSPIMPALVKHFGGGSGSEWTVQAAMSISVFGMAVAGMFSSPLVARFGFRLVLFFSWLLFAVFGTAPMFAEGAATLLASRFFLGVSAGLLFALAGIAVAARYKDDDAGRTRLMGINMAVGPASALIFLFLAAWVARIQWYAPFTLYGIFGLLGMALVLSTNLPSTTQHSNKSSVSGLARGLKPALPAYALIVVALIAQNLFNVQIVFLMASRGMGDPSMVSIAISVMTIGMMPACALYSLVLSRLGLSKTIFVGIAFQAIAALLCGISAQFSFTIAGMACAGIGIGLGVMSATQLIMSRTSPEYVSVALGISSTEILFVSSLAPFAYVPLKAVIGGDGIYVVSAVILAFGLITWPLVRRVIHRKATA